MLCTLSYILITERMLRGAGLCHAVCFYGMSGQMNTLLDRSNLIFPAEYVFRDIYLLAVADADEVLRAGQSRTSAYDDCLTVIISV
jgi:hypothetical protein